MRIQQPPATGNPALDAWLQRLPKQLFQRFYDRGDPAAADWVETDLTTDGSWHDLDLSSIVPEDTICVCLAVEIKYTATEFKLEFRKKGYTNNLTNSISRTQAVNVWNSNDCIVACDEDRFIQYRGSNVATPVIYVTVKGWWI